MIAPYIVFVKNITHNIWYFFVLTIVWGVDIIAVHALNKKAEE